MGILTNEYMDVKQKKHRVEHITHVLDDGSKERLLDELFQVLIRPNGHISA